ncbi:hypothetical protein FQA39_LY11695 [Lamprigera yunnana]|nr:hypothetical protein FQA39_LY11695 [Lamprigera yunnana]
MDVVGNESCAITSEVILNETFLFYQKYEDYESEEVKMEPVDVKEEHVVPLHINTHAGVEYQLKECDYETLWERNLKDHMKIYIGVEHKCNECNYKTFKKCNLKHHTKIHMGIEYTCNECDYKTMSEHNLKHHTHSLMEWEKPKVYSVNNLC